MSETPVKQQNTAAFYGQAVASFSVAMAATALGIFKLHADAWVRGFLAIAVEAGEAHAHVGEEGTTAREVVPGGFS